MQCNIMQGNAMQHINASENCPARGLPEGVLSPAWVCQNSAKLQSLNSWRGRHGMQIKQQLEARSKNTSNNCSHATPLDVLHPWRKLRLSIQLRGAFFIFL
eukprot:scaffold279091_cov28-Prasinocladus_malaysianus.AAC.1